MTFFGLLFAFNVAVATDSISAGVAAAIGLILLDGFCERIELAINDRETDQSAAIPSQKQE